MGGTWPLVNGVERRPDRAGHRLRRLHRLAPDRVAARPTAYASIGVDCFNDNYGRAREAPQPRPRAQWDAFDFVPLDLARGDLGDLVAESRRRLPPGGRARRALELGHALRELHAQQRERHAAPARGGQPAPGSALRVRVVVVDLRTGRALPTPEDTLCRPFSPYGVTKLAAEHLCDALPRQPRRRRSRCATSRSTGRGSGPTWRSAVSAEAILERRADHALRRRRADARLHLRRRRRRRALRAAATTPAASGRVYNIGGGNAGQRQRGAPTPCRRIAERRLDVEYVAAQRGDVERTAADTTRARRELGFAPARRHRRRSVEGVRVGPRARRRRARPLRPR